VAGAEAEYLVKCIWASVSACTSPCHLKGRNKKSAQRTGKENEKGRRAGMKRHQKERKIRYTPRDICLHHLQDPDVRCKRGM
jgi:hypothetical protein